MSSEVLAAAAAATERPVWRIGMHGEQIGAAPSWCAFTGQTAAEASGAGWLDAIDPADRETVAALWSGRPQAKAECRVRRPNGKYTRAELTAARIDGEPASWVCSLAEVWADATVRQSEERLRLATQAANVAVWEYDFIAGQMTRTSNHDGLYGLAPLVVWTYDAFTNATHPDDREPSNQVVQRAVAPGGPDQYAMDFRVVWPDGSTHWLACTGDVLRRDAEGRATLVRGTLSDVTRLKAVEAELREAVRVREDFLEVASHELNTPLTPLGIKLARLRRRGETLSAAEYERDLDVAVSQYQRLTGLVGELLDVTRLSRARLELNRAPTDLVTAVRAAVGALSAEQRGLVTIEGEARLDGVWDPVRIGQIVHNLLGNALKYGRGRPVRVVLERAAGKARLRVIDEGIGIEPEMLRRLFGKFERGPSSRSYGGLGLGLYIVKQLVQQHGGDVSVDSTVDVGTTFTVELPYS